MNTADNFGILLITVAWSSSRDHDPGVDRKWNYFPNEKQPRRVSGARRYHVSAVEMGTITSQSATELLVFHREHCTIAERSVCPAKISAFEDKVVAFSCLFSGCVEISSCTWFLKGPLPPSVGIELRFPPAVLSQAYTLHDSHAGGFQDSKLTSKPLRVSQSVI